MNMTEIARNRLAASKGRMERKHNEHVLALALDHVTHLRERSERALAALRVSA